MLLHGFPVKRCQLLEQLPQAPPPRSGRAARCAAAGLHRLLAARRLHARCTSCSDTTGRAQLAMAP